MDRKCKDVAVGDQTTLNIGPIVRTTITKVLGSNGWGKQSPLFLDQLSSHISFQITALNKPQPAGTYGTSQLFGHSYSNSYYGPRMNAMYVLLGVDDKIVNLY